MGGDAEARTATVARLHRIPHDEPDEPGDFLTKEYRQGLEAFVMEIVTFGAIVVAFILVYRTSLLVARCVRRERWERSFVDGGVGRAGLYRIALMVSVAGVVAAAVSGLLAESELLRGVKNVGDAIGRIVALLEHLQRVVVDMARATASITRATKRVECSGSELEDFVGDVEIVNGTVLVVQGVFDDMIDPVERVEAQVRSRGREWVTSGVRAVVLAPNLFYFACMTLAVVFSEAQRANNLRWHHHDGHGACRAACGAPSACCAESAACRSRGRTRVMQRPFNVIMAQPPVERDASTLSGRPER